MLFGVPGALEAADVDELGDVIGIVAPMWAMAEYQDSSFLSSADSISFSQAVEWLGRAETPARCQRYKARGRDFCRVI